LIRKYVIVRCSCHEILLLYPIILIDLFQNNRIDFFLAKNGL
jgi:hypothetical protein